MHAASYEISFAATRAGRHHVSNLFSFFFLKDFFLQTFRKKEHPWGTVWRETIFCLHMNASSFFVSSTHIERGERARSRRRMFDSISSIFLDRKKSILSFLTSPLYVSVDLPVRAHTSWSGTRALALLVAKTLSRSVRIVLNLLTATTFSFFILPATENEGWYVVGTTKYIGKINVPPERGGRQRVERS